VICLGTAGWAGDGVSFGVRHDFGVEPLPAAVIAADFNMDGVPDLAAASLGIESVAVLLGRGDGSFAPQSRFAAGRAPCALAAGDFNCDGVLDLAVGDCYSNSVAVLLGTGDGTFAAPFQFAVGRRPASGVW